MVWVYISMISWDGNFLIWTDWCREVWPVPVELKAAPLDCVCKCFGWILCRQWLLWHAWCGYRCSWCQCCRCDRCCGSCCWSGRQRCRGSGCHITADGCIRTGGIWMFKNVVASTPRLLHWWLVLGLSHWCLHKWWWQGATGSWHHWGQRKSVQQSGDFFCNLGSNDMQHSGKHIHQEFMISCTMWVCSAYAVALCWIIFIGTEALQGSTDVQWWVCCSMLGVLSIILVRALCTGEKSFDNLHSSFCLVLISWIPACTCDQTSNLLQIQHIMELQIVGYCQCIGILEFHVLQITPLCSIMSLQHSNGMQGVCKHSVFWE